MGNIIFHIMWYDLIWYNHINDNNSNTSSKDNDDDNNNNNKQQWQ